MTRTGTVAPWCKVVHTYGMSDTVIPSWTLGDRLAKAREDAGISVNAMAERLHVARTTISNWEHDRAKPSHPVIIAYSAETRVPVSWLVGENPGTMSYTATYTTSLKDAA